MTRSTRRIPAVVIAAVAAIMSGCGGGGGSAAPDTAALERATRDFAVKLFSGGEGTYDYLSEACRDEMPETEWESSLAVAMVFFQAFTGGGDAEDLVGDIETRDVTTDKGESLFHMNMPETTEEGVTVTETDDWIPWKVEDGKWRITDCEGVLGGDDSDDGDDTGDDPFGGEPSELDFDGAPTGVEIDLADMFESPTTGSASIRLLQVDEVESPIESESYGKIRAKGRFVAVRYEVTNDTDVALHQFFDVVTALDATDGEVWYEVNDGAASDALSAEREGDDSTADLEAGGTATAWIVFDVPEDTEVVGLGYRPGFFEATALSLP